MTIKDIKIGDYVKVKDGITSPDSKDQLMDNWLGKVTDIQAKEQLVSIQWDAETLLNTPEDYLLKMINEGYDHENMTLEISELEKTTRRNTPKQEKVLSEKFYSKIQWVEIFGDFPEQFAHYAEVFRGLNDEYEIYQKWEEYLNERLTFPILTEVAFAERGPIREGAKVKLLALDDYDDMYGILGIGKYNSETIVFPICNLEAIDQKSMNYQLLQDYAIWFANK